MTRAPLETTPHRLIASGKRIARIVVRAGRLLWQRAILTRLTVMHRRGREWRQATFIAGTGREPITLFLAPEAGLSPFYASHVILARLLHDAGHPVLMLSCNGLQPTCSLKIAMHVKPTRPHEGGNAACVRCRMAAYRVGATYGLPDISLEELLDDSKRAEIDRVMASYAAAPWDAVYDGFPIGAGCLGEALRTNRRTTVAELDDRDKTFVRALLYSALAIYLAVKELGDRFKIERIAYFGDYAYFLPPQIYAARHGIPLTNVCHAYHRDTDRRYLNLWPKHAIAHQLDQVQRWTDYQTAAIDPQTIADIADGALFRLYGHGGISTYSPNWSESSGDLLKELGLPSGGKLIVVYTNSTDEVVCHQHTLRTLGEAYDDARNPFPNQIEWLRQLIVWVAGRPDLRLVIRLHPRMAVSARHLNVASEYTQMKAAFVAPPPNVAVVWPESPISSYNLAELADVALTAWSSIGLELARFGVPVIAAFQRIGPFPRSAFIGFEETPASYFAALEHALERRPDLETIIAAFRWTHFLHWTPLIDIADVVPQPDYADVPPFRTPRNVDTILDVLTRGKDIVAINMARLPTSAAATAAERSAVLASIEKFLLYFMTGRVRDRGDVHAAADSDNNVTLVDGDRTIRRHSPLASRLVRILDETRVSIDA